jgi:hypothetical protein
VGPVTQIILGPVAWTLQVAMEPDVTDNRLWADRLAFATLPANKTLLLDEMQVLIESVFKGGTYRGPSGPRE